MSVLIREPVASDAPQLGRAHAAAWHAAYTGMMPASVLENVTTASRTRMWERVIAVPRAEREHIAVAEVDGVAVGFAWTSVCRDEGSPEGLGELQAINLDPGHWGTGVGGALLEAAHDALARAGFTEAILWVLPGNARARRFYEARGWHSDGVERDLELPGAEDVAELRYSRRIETATTGVNGALGA
ncbi:GNAT family N-acetyltransferase [Actinospica durhamensis]|uniref:GNAT family N-acetyltransferase n=1 Tax=Actinospica durhamensis TaxID=1508375 RepID=A0A941EUW5_9ACTN|nr:GNAT family N-acetyltransferase [Actinospica durhamensis]MBR7837683.1 GNAT family N-acetyltransferase [Actinospica durhamensis]